MEDRDQNVYVISLDTLDLNLLPAIYNIQDDRIAPVFAKTQDRPNEEYYQFQITCKDSEESVKDDSPKLEFENVICDICDIEVPKPFLGKHRKSSRHITNVKIAEIALYRMKKYINNIDTKNHCTNCDETDPSVYFCTTCITIVDCKEKSAHEKSLAHKNGVILEKIFTDFLLLYHCQEKINDENKKKVDLDANLSDAVLKFVNSTVNIDDLSNKGLKSNENQIGTSKEMKHDIPKNEALAAQTESPQMSLKDYLTLINSRVKHPMFFKLINDDNHLIEIETIDGSIVKVREENFHAFNRVGKKLMQCYVCKETFKEKFIEKHKISEKHIQYMISPLEDKNCLRKIDKCLSHCLICNRITEYSDLHSLCDKDHEENLKEALISDKVDDNQYSRKELDKNNTTIAKHNFTKIKEKGNKWVEVLKKVEKDDAENSVTTNERKVPSVIPDRYFCTSCKEYVSIYCRSQHNEICFSNEYVAAVSEKIEKEKDIMSIIEFFHCNVCDVKVPNNEHNIQEHINGKRHALSANLVTDIHYVNIDDLSNKGPKSNEKQIGTSKEVKHDVPKNEALAAQTESRRMSLKDYLTLINSRVTHPMFFKLTNDNNHLIEIETIDGSIVKVREDNFHAFNRVGKNLMQCYVCKETFKEKFIEEHKISEKHIQYMITPLEDKNCSRKIDKCLSHCLICNRTTEYSDLHSLCDKDHEENLKEALISDKVDDNQYSRKELDKNNTTIAKHNFTKIKEKGNKWVEVLKKVEKDDAENSVTTNERKVPSVIPDRYFCTSCKEYVSIYCRSQHNEKCFSNEYVAAVSEKIEKEKDTMSIIEFFHCNVCDVKVPNNEHNIQEHINGKRHALSANLVTDIHYVNIDDLSNKGPKSNEKQIGTSKEVKHDVPKNEALAAQTESRRMSLKDYLTLINSRVTHPMFFKLTNDNNHLIEIETIDGSIVKVREDNFHAFNRVGKNLMQCYVCKETFKEKFIEEHKISEKHIQYMITPLEDKNCSRKIDKCLKHCLICNRIMEYTSSILDFHSFCDKDHIENLKEALISDKVENIQYSRKELDKYTTIAKDDFTKIKEKDKYQKDNKKVLKKVEKDDAESSVTTNEKKVPNVIPDRYFCTSCKEYESIYRRAQHNEKCFSNEYVAAVSEKIEKEKDTMPIIEFFHCNVCNVKVPNNEHNIQEHMNGKSHALSVTKTNHSADDDENSDIPKVVTDIHYLMEPTKVLNLLNCKVCNVITLHNKTRVSEHLASEKHLMNYKKLLKDSYLVLKTNDCYCNICKAFVGIKNEIMHIHGKKHNSNREKLKLSNVSTVSKSTGILHSIDNPSVSNVKDVNDINKSSVPNVKDVKHISNLSVSNVKDVNNQNKPSVPNVKDLNNINKPSVSNVKDIKIMDTSISKSDFNSLIAGNSKIKPEMLVMLQPTPNPKEVICKICNVKVPFNKLNVSTHLNGIKHKYNNFIQT